MRYGGLNTRCKNKFLPKTEKQQRIKGADIRHEKGLRQHEEGGSEKN